MGRLENQAPKAGRNPRKLGSFVTVKAPPLEQLGGMLVQLARDPEQSVGTTTTIATGHCYWKEFQTAFLSFVLLVPVLPAMNIQLARPRSWACSPVDKENENLDFWTIQWEPMPSHPSMFLTGGFPWQSEGRSNDGQPKPQQRKCPC